MGEEWPVRYLAGKDARTWEDWEMLRMSFLSQFLPFLWSFHSELQRASLLLEVLKASPGAGKAQAFKILWIWAESEERAPWCQACSWENHVVLVSICIKGTVFQIYERNWTDLFLLDLVKLLSNLVKRTMETEDSSWLFQSSSTVSTSSTSRTE